VKRFFDTNILVYAFLDIDKRDKAIAVLAEGGRISVQVLNEFTNVARQKRQRPWPEIEAAITVIREWFPDIVPLTEQTHARALALARDHGLSFYDALIVAAAQEAGCDTLFTEDMQHGRKFGSLNIVNPFIEAAP
jgi:predicted nucleic acid-binding protein